MTVISTLQFSVFILVLVLTFGIILFLLRRSHRETNAQTAESYDRRLVILDQKYDTKLAQLNQDLTHLASQVEDDLVNRAADWQELQRTNQQLLAELAEAEAAVDARRLRAWLDRIERLHLTHEYEVETQVVYPLLTLLGYQDARILLKQPVLVGPPQAPVTAFVNFLVYQDEACQQPALLVYVATPTKEVDQHLVQRARAYGFAANCTQYMVTNGRDFHIRQLRVREDIVIHQGDLARLIDNWQPVRQSLGLA